jgi:hypothetical protein
VWVWFLDRRYTKFVKLSYNRGVKCSAHYLLRVEGNSSVFFGL